MAEIGEKIELSEGDLVMTFNKTIDLMRQVREMLIDVKTDHPISATLVAAERLLRRGIVEQSLTIGYAPINLPDEVSFVRPATSQTPEQEPPAPSPRGRRTTGSSPTRPSPAPRPLRPAPKPSKRKRR